MKENFRSIYTKKKKNILHGGKRLKKNKSTPILTIITVVLNGEKFLEKTIKSVMKQKKIYEYIIIDGNSKDNSLNIIKKVIYQIRCNIFHGEKVPGDINDDRIAVGALPMLKLLVEKLIEDYKIE